MTFSILSRKLMISESELSKKIVGKMGFKVKYGKKMNSWHELKVRQKIKNVGLYYTLLSGF